MLGASSAEDEVSKMKRIRGWELAAGAILGLLLGFLFWGRDVDRPRDVLAGPQARSALADGNASTVAAERELERLRGRFQAEAERRRLLEQRLAQRQEQRDVQPRPSDSGSERPGAPEPGDEKGNAARERVPDGWPAPTILERAGMRAGEIDELQARLEEIALERLYLRDQATREGWVGKPRFRRSMRELDGSYRELGDEYGEDAYDWILFAAGRDNRIQVTRVMAGSAAEDAGLEAGDVVVGYADERIFDGPSLQRATTTGEAGETVVLDVVRGGEVIRVYPPRGPLGVTLESIKVEPGPLR
jgi:hypothetical protein